MAKVRVILNKSVKGYPTGYKFTSYGHNFVVQKDGTAAAMIDEDFTKIEIPAGRYKLAEEAPKEIPTLDTSYVDSFGYDIGQYYGAGSLEKLKERVEDMRKGELSYFAQTRLGLKLNFNASKNRMIFELIDKIKTELETKQPNEPEKKIKVPIASKDDANPTMFTFVEPEEKAASPEKKVPSPIKDKSRNELMAELDELEKLAEQRKTKIEPEKIP